MFWGPLDFETPPYAPWIWPIHHLKWLKSPDGMFYIQDEKEETLRPQVPVHYDLGQIPALISISDQGPSNHSSPQLFALQSKCSLDLVHLGTLTTRAWNDRWTGVGTQEKQGQCMEKSSRIQPDLQYELWTYTPEV